MKPKRWGKLPLFHERTEKNTEPYKGIVKFERIQHDIENAYNDAIVWGNGVSNAIYYTKPVGWSGTVQVDVSEPPVKKNKEPDLGWGFE